MLMQFNYKAVKIGIINVKGFKNVWGAVVPYVAPEATGDELSDLITETTAYREWKHAYEKAVAERDAHEEMLRELKAFGSIDIEAKLETELVKALKNDDKTKNAIKCLLNVPYPSTKPLSQPETNSVT